MAPVADGRPTGTTRRDRRPAALALLVLLAGCSRAGTPPSPSDSADTLAVSASRGDSAILEQSRTSTSRRDSATSAARAATNSTGEPATVPNQPTRPKASVAASSKPAAPASPAPDTVPACPQTPGQIVLEEVNRIRTRAGLPRLSVDLRLVAAAMTQARDIAAGAPVGHVGLDGSLPDHRVRKEGYEWSRVGENVAAGVPAAKEVVADWMSSPHHRENILGGGFTQIGIAFLDRRSSAYGTYWVQVFATPLDPKAQGRPARCNP